jgi:hypothetical protein
MTLLLGIEIFSIIPEEQVSLIFWVIRHLDAFYFSELPWLSAPNEKDNSNFAEVAICFRQSADLHRTVPRENALSVRRDRLASLMCMCLASARWPEGSAPKGQESLAQGLPWVSGNRRFALKGLEAHAIRSRGSEPVSRAYLVAPSGPVRVGEISQGEPWAGLSYFGHFGPRIGRPRALRKGSKHVLGCNQSGRWLG